MHNRPVIIVVTYNRPNSLLRLLASLKVAKYSNIDEITLIISIDKTESAEVYQIAEDFEWIGNKIVIKHEVRLGLKKHILSCGDLTSTYGAVIILEDDLFVSPFFYEYTEKALDFYNNKTEIAGISLFNYKYLENLDLLFHPYFSGFDTYFIQYASSWGQAWTLKQWDEFKQWYQNNNEWEVDDKRIPSFVLSWPEKSWKKYFIKYLIERNKLVVYPYISYTTNFGEIGANEGYKNNLHQVNLNQGLNINFGLIEFFYDAYFQINPSFLKKMNPQLAEYQFVVDLFGNKSKDIIKTEFVLTTRCCKNHIMSFSLELYPPELNIIYNIKGRDIYLAEVEDVDFNSNSCSKLLKYSYHLSDFAIQKIQNLLPPLRIQLKKQLFYHLKKLFK